MESLPNQNDQPTTVFIFGAGASYDDGVPLQANILPLIIKDEDPQLKYSETAKRLRGFLTEHFAHGEQTPSLEEVFGFIDFFINYNLALSKQWGVKELIEIKGDFSKTVHYLISKSTQKSVAFRKFWKKVRSIEPEVGVITTNYDTLIDEAFDAIYPECLIDYCLDFINFRHPNAGVPFDWWIDPKKPTEHFEYNRLTRIKLIKIHGSLNWKYCSCCGQIALTPWQHQYNLKLDSFQSFFESQITECPFEGARLISLLQMPTHLKSNNNFIFSKLYDEASYLVGNAKQLVFIGYSFPEADVHIRALVRRCFSEDGKIIVINKSRAKDLKYRYEGLAKNVDYYEYTFERFVKSRIFEELLSANKTLQGTARFARR
jgi:NAD-dependent SIR2 family protein deacetylase